MIMLKMTPTIPKEKPDKSAPFGTKKSRATDSDPASTGDLRAAPLSHGRIAFTASPILFEQMTRSNFSTATEIRVHNSNRYARLRFLRIICRPALDSPLRRTYFCCRNSM